MDNKKLLEIVTKIKKLQAKKYLTDAQNSELLTLKQSLEFLVKQSNIKDVKSFIKGLIGE